MSYPSQSGIFIITDHRLCIVIPYIKKLVSNINKCFSDASFQLLKSSAIFHPASIPKGGTRHLIIKEDRDAKLG